MTIAQYSSFWFPVVGVFFALVFAVLVIFDYLYGRHFRALARVLLHGDDEANGQRTALLERLDNMLSRLSRMVRR